MTKLIISLGNPFVTNENNVIDTVNSLLDAKQNKLEFDNEPLENSINPVTSGGIYQAIKELKNEIGELKTLITEMEK